MYCRNMQDRKLKREVVRFGGVNAVARALNVTPCSVYFWLNGTRKPSDKFLSLLGLARRVEYVKQ